MISVRYRFKISEIFKIKHSASGRKVVELALRKDLVVMGYGLILGLG